MDNLVGTDLNDTFIAAPVDKSDTLQIFDSINGGAGTDTLNIYAVGEDNISQVGTVTGVEIINIYNTLADIEFGDSAVDASKFVGSQQVWQIDGANSIKDLAGTQTAGFRGEGVDDFTVTASGAEANIAFDGAKRVGSSGAIDFIVAGTKLSTVNLSGAFASASTAATTEITSGTNVTSLTVNSSLSAKNTLTIKDAADSAGGDKLTTLNLNIAKDSTVTVTDLNNLVSVNASASTGGIKLITAAPSVNSISTGSGNDEVSLATAFNGTVVSASVSTGSGNDKITVGTTGTGRVTVDAGSGTDTINLTSEVLTADDTIDGGAGDDTALILGSVGERTAENLVILRNNIINVETLAFESSEGEDTNAFDASSLKNVFTKLAFVGTTSDSFVENISTETILVVDGANVDLTAKDYDAAEDIFGGDLDVVVTTDGYKANEDSASVPYVVYSKVTAQGEDLALNVLANSSKESSRGESSNNGTPISALLAVEIEGDVRTATINLSSSVNTPVGGAADSINVALVDINTESSTNPTGSLTALTSITLAGNGIAFVQNENGSKLASVSALGLSSTIGSFYKFNDYDAAVLFGETLEAGLARSVYGGDYVAGDKSFGLIYNTENAGIAETITLGSSVDIIKFNNGSTFAKMDKVIGLNLELNKAGTALSNQSDGIFVVGSGFTGSNVDFAKLSSIELASIAQKAGNNLELYLTEVAKLNQDEVVFHLNGNTYVFVDYGDDVLESTDQVIELVGSINLDTLLVSLNNPSGGV